jgi:hypothetical protein
MPRLIRRSAEGVTMAVYLKKGDLHEVGNPCGH